MRLSHLDARGKARMVDVSGKPVSSREAVAKASVSMKASTMKLIRKGAVPKGDVMAAARIAGIMAAKKTPDLIPLCHPLDITSVAIEIAPDAAGRRLDITATVKTVGQTGVEMEALVAVSVAALTVYDMCKAVDKEMTISDVMLLEKRGGRSGEFKRAASAKRRTAAKKSRKK